MSTNPLVSIVTPSFNQAQFLEETLRSVELQQYRPIHQIVIDGGSTDGSVEILKRWELKDHGPGYTFEWISERDRGHADALNKGFDHVQGEFVGWLNSDDVYFDRQVMSTSVAAFKAHPDVDVVHGEAALISEESGLQIIWCFPPFNYDRALRGYIIPQPSVFFRRNVIEKHRLDSSLRVAIDQVYWLQIGREHKFLKIHRIQAGDRDQPARISRVSADALFETTQKACTAYGAKATPSVGERLLDGLWRAALRIRGFIYIMGLLCCRNLEKRTAFPLWIDSGASALKLQLTMRILKRADLGRRPTRRSNETYVSR